MSELANTSAKAAAVSLAARLRTAIETLYPGYFAFVMATGIISNALFFEHQRELADVLFFVNLAAYPILWLLTALRVVWARAALWADLTSPKLVFAFFTVVAANAQRRRRLPAGRATTKCGCLRLL